MRRNLILCTLSLCFVVVAAQPVLAQDVLVLPKQDPTPQPQTTVPPSGQKNPDDKKPDTGTFWGNLFPGTKPLPKDAKPKPAPTNPTIVAPPGTGKGKDKDKQKVEIPPLPKDVEAAAAKTRDSINSMLDSLRNQPTQVFEQPEYLPSPDKDDRVYEKPLAVSIESLKFREDDLKNAAAGTPYTAKDILENCQPRITGTVIGQNNSAELLDVRGTKVTSKTGFKGSIQNIPLILGLGCKLERPPNNKGITIKMGEYYVFGVAQGVCLPPDNHGVTSLSIAYNEGVFNCKYK
ncbi:MAG: hypothetical protein KBA75_06005 [Alphaproteobacteria bacterium]|nr:hypothetical protein [Alphaproteobacteria bacterium]